MARRRRYSYTFLGVLGFFGVFQFWNVMTSVRVWISSSWEKCTSGFLFHCSFCQNYHHHGYERVALPSATFVSIILPSGMWVQVNHILCSYITRWFIIFIWRRGKQISVLSKAGRFDLCEVICDGMLLQKVECLNAMVINSVASYPWFLLRTKIWAHSWAVTGREGLYSRNFLKFLFGYFAL